MPCDSISADEVFRIIRTGQLDRLEEYLSENKKLVHVTRWSGFTLLHRASGLGNIDICDILLKHGADVNARSVRGWYTPLHVALANGFVDTAAFLVDNGAKPWTRSKYGEDPYEYGIKRGFRQVSEDFRGRIMKIEIKENLKRHKELLMTERQDDGQTEDEINADSINVNNVSCS